VAYLKKIAQKPTLVWDTPEARLKQFQEAFGDDLGELDHQFLRYIERIGRP